MHQVERLGPRVSWTAGRVRDASRESNARVLAQLHDILAPS